MNIVGSCLGIGFCFIALLVLHNDKGFGTTLERVEERQPVIFCLLVLRKRSYWILRRRRKIADLHFSVLIGCAGLGTNIDKCITTSTQKALLPQQIWTNTYLYFVLVLSYSTQGSSNAFAYICSKFVSSLLTTQQESPIFLSPNKR